MEPVFSQTDRISVVASDANWAWPQALQGIFQPLGVDFLVAGSTNDFVDILRQRRVHTTIIDLDAERLNGLATVRIIRIEYPAVPCILLASDVGQMTLREALRLNIFSVIDKPVDMALLREQLNRLFVKRYGSHIFSR
jgi:DNA-binding NtrC family response regulator